MNGCLDLNPQPPVNPKERISDLNLSECLPVVYGENAEKGLKKLLPAVRLRSKNKIEQRLTVLESLASPMINRMLGNAHNYVSSVHFLRMLKLARALVSSGDDIGTIQFLICAVYGAAQTFRVESSSLPV